MIDDDAYPPIGDYAVIGDCRAAALVSKSGSIDWLCLPYFSADAVFAALLDRRKGGCFAVRPVEDYTVSRRYLPGSAILETRFATSRGIVTLTDAMVITGETGLQPQREVLRIVKSIEGEVDIEIVYRPCPHFATIPATLRHRDGMGWFASWGNEVLVLQSEVPLSPDPQDAAVLRGRVSLKGGRAKRLALTYSRNDPAVIVRLGEDADRRMTQTRHWWERWSDACCYQGAYGDAVIRSAITLKLLTYALSGAVVAAPSTSLPEWIGGSRNWDYRFCWLRDASLTLEVFMDLGYAKEGRHFLEWLLHATRLSWPHLHVLYDVYGESRLPERHLDHFEGYRGSQPVRVGNGAWHQRQHDIYGAVIMAAGSFVQRGGKLHPTEQRFLVGIGKAICRIWDTPDQGIWEVRGAPRHHTHGKISSWAALDCLLSLKQMGALGSVPEKIFKENCQAIRHAVMTRAYNTNLQAFVGEYDSECADASLFLMPRFRFIDARDPRFQRTCDFLLARLDRGDGKVMRYEPGFDPVDEPEHPFGITSFWAVEALARTGRRAEAEERFECLLALANDVGLYGEEMDKETGRPMGNFPQAFTHIGLIAAAITLMQSH